MAAADAEQIEAANAEMERLAAERELAQRAVVEEALAANPFLRALPAVYGQALATAIEAGVSAALASKRRLCAECLRLRLEWNGRHQGELERAQALAMAMHKITDPADPRLAQIDLPAFLPGHLRPGQPEGLPQMLDAVTMTGGQEVCVAHHPAVTKALPRLIAVAGLGVHAAAQMAMGGPSGLPGIPAG
jgi:hypothetical protein